MDFEFIALTLIYFGITWGLIALSEKSQGA